MLEGIHERAVGRWRSILPQLGVDARFLNGKHGPCPNCGGKDRFRFTDHEGRGGFYCNGCGPGSGVDLVMRMHKVGFMDAVKLIEPLIPSAPVYVPKATKQDKPAFTDGSALWKRGLPIQHGDSVSLYLQSRGLSFDAYPSQLRILPRAVYVDDDKNKQIMPAMLAQFVSPCRSWTTVHITYLTEEGQKARVEKVRKFHPGKIPEGGAVRLSASAETMGVAEGIETALAAQMLFEVPVWATLSTIGLTKWEPPQSVKHVIVFGDADEKFAGQHAAYALAYRLAVKGLNVEVRLPDEVGTDWNDVWRFRN